MASGDGQLRNGSYRGCVGRSMTIANGSVEVLAAVSEGRNDGVFTTADTAGELQVRAFPDGLPIFLTSKFPVNLVY